MPRVLKVFAQGNDQRLLADYGQVLAGYDAFAIVEPARGNATALRRRFPTEDISAQYALPVAAPSKGPTQRAHHYLVQFVGPVKRQWLARVKRQGGELREPYSDFTYVVRANLAVVEALRTLPFVRWV